MSAMGNMYFMDMKKALIKITLYAFAGMAVLSGPALAEEQTEETIEYFSAERLSGVLSPQMLSSSAFVCDQSDCAAGTVLKPEGQAIYQKFDLLRVKPSGQHSFNIGDTIDIAAQLRKISFQRQRYPLMRPSGLAVVRSVDQKGIINAELLEYWYPISGKESVMPSRARRAVEIPKLSSTKQNLESVVVTRVEDRNVTFVHDMLIIGAGGDSGVRIGDVFTVVDKDSGELDKALLIGTVINTSASFSTLLINKIVSEERLNQGDRAILKLRISEE